MTQEKPPARVGEHNGGDYDMRHSMTPTTKAATADYEFDALGEPRTRYVRVILDGATMVISSADAEEFNATAKANDDNSDYEFKDVYLSERELDDLPEFEGF